MAIIKQGGAHGSNAPYRGQVMTTMGYRAKRPPLCMVCGERKDGIYTINGNGKEVCPDCASPHDRAILTGCGSADCQCESEEYKHGRDSD